MFKVWIRPDVLYIQKFSNRLCYRLSSYLNSEGNEVTKICYVRGVFKGFFKITSEPFEVLSDTLHTMELIKQ